MRAEGADSGEGKWETRDTGTSGAGCTAGLSRGWHWPSARWWWWPGRWSSSLVAKLATGGDPGLEGIAVWVPGLFYGSWLLWATATGAATRSYQLRSAALRMPLPLLAGTTCAVN